MNPLFSIIIPLYNKDSYILDTLKSITKQTYTNYEVIIINDGSTDNSKTLTENYIKKFKKAIIINQQNKGLSYSRNLGIKKAKGKIIALLDADDRWHPDFLKTIYNLHNTFKEATIYGTDYFEVKNNKLLRPNKNLDPKLENSSFIIDNFFKLNTHQSIICQSSMCLKKEVFNSVSYNEEITLSEDIDFYLNIFSKGNKLAYYYKALSSIYIDVPNQITQSGIQNKTIPNFDSYENIAKSDLNLKKYLDFNRYIFASKYKLSKDKKKFKLITKNLDLNNLNNKQRFLLTCPYILFKIILRIKILLFKFNIKWTTFN